jgi:energy-coupling factor transport system permease protein
MQENNAAPALARLDPRTKLALLALSFVMALLPERPLAAGAAWCLVLLHAALAGALPHLARVRWLLASLAAFTVVIWAVLARGPTVLWWRISAESLAFGLATFLKLAAMLTAGLTLLATTPVEELFLGLVKLKVPYPVAFAFALALRWVPEVMATARRVLEAQEVRGLTVAAVGPAARLRRYLPLLVPIFLLTLKRSQTVALALEARGFQAGPRRTYLLTLKPTWRDAAVLALAVAAAAAFAALHLLRLDRIPGLQLP